MIIPHSPLRNSRAHLPAKRHVEERWHHHFIVKDLRNTCAERMVSAVFIRNGVSIKALVRTRGSVAVIARFDKRQGKGTKDVHRATSVLG